MLLPNRVSLQCVGKWNFWLIKMWVYLEKSYFDSCTSWNVNALINILQWLWNSDWWVSLFRDLKVTLGLVDVVIESERLSGSVFPPTSTIYHGSYFFFNLFFNYGKIDIKWTIFLILRVHFSGLMHIRFVVQPSPLPIRLQNCLHLSELKLYTSQAITPHTLSPLGALGNRHPVSVCTNLTTPGASCTCNHTVFVLWWLVIPLRITSSSFIDVVAGVRCWISSHCT